jgi:hypothetical protein
MGLLGFLAHGTAQKYSETLLSTDNAYNPIPSPNAEYVAYVRTGLGRRLGIVGFGRSSLISEIAVMDAHGNPVFGRSVANLFLSGWTHDSAALICYRDGEYSLVSVNGQRSSNGRIERLNAEIGGPERVSYLPSLGMIWSRQDRNTALEGQNGVIAAQVGWLGELISPSPNGRYLAVTSSWSQSDLWVYDVELKKWTKLGDIQIHPDREWDYIKPSWSPWSADSSRLAYFSHNHSVLSISTPDGKQRSDIATDGIGGLAAPSPHGDFIAYVTFEPRPMRGRPDLQFWGGTTIWITSSSGRTKPFAITQKSLDEVYDLRWLDEQSLVFDRVADVPFYKQARIWKVVITASPTESH